MRTVRISKDNYTELKGIISGALYEFLAGDDFYGLAEYEDDADSPSAAMVYRMTKDKNEEGCFNAHIFGLYFENEEACHELIRAFEIQAEFEKVIKVTAGIADIEMWPDRAFLEKEGYSVSIKESRELHLTVGDTMEVEFLKKISPSSKVKSLGSLKPSVVRKKLDEFADHSNREIVRVSADWPMDWFDPELSCYVGNPNDPEGFIFVHVTFEGEIRVQAMVYEGNDPTDLLKLLRVSSLKAAELYPPETKMSIFRNDEASKMLVQKIMPDKKGEDILYFEKTMH